MKNITYISAGAGSGKTYTLTHKLADLFISDPGLHPEQIILTTFTRKAAAELMNRTREILCEYGHYDTATRLDNALIGTVHSIGHALISKYWYYLGVSPKLNILDEKGLKKYIDLTIGTTATKADINFFHKLIHAFGVKPNSYGSTPLDWKSNLKDIIEKAHNFGKCDFDVCILKSNQLIDDAYRFDQEIPDPYNMVGPAISVLSQLRYICKERYATARGRNKNKPMLIMQAAQRLLYKLKNFKGNADILDCLSLFIGADMKEIMENDTAACYRFPELDEFEETCKKLIYCPDAIMLMKEYVRRIFDLAKNWENEYYEYKRDHCIVDYNDIEILLAELLDKEEITNEIRNSYRYLMVDEFQDCNTVQINIFQRLAELMQHTWWVGDKKQSIYGFRGSNTGLVDAVTADIKHGMNGCTRENLPNSYRSVPKLVEFANQVFSNVFAGMEDVCLKPTLEDCPDIEAIRLVRVPLVGRQQTNNPKGVANMIAAMINDPAYKSVCPVLDKFAVLVRKDTQVVETANALRNLGIPVCSKVDVNTSREWMLLSALLTLCENHENELARATIAHLVKEGYTVPFIIDSKLEYDKGHNTEEKAWLLDISLISAAIKFSSINRHLSVSAFVKTIIKSLGLEAYSEAWPDGCKSAWPALVTRAEEYESGCMALGINSTLQGFITYENDEKPSAIEKDAVQVLTYHGAKGLQWPVTILLSLDDDHIDPNTIVAREIYNVSIINDGEYNIIRLLPQVTANPSDAVVANLDKCGHVKPASEKVKSEESRLLYVGVTRASHQLVLVTHQGDDAKPYNWFGEMGITPDMGLIPAPIEFTRDNVNVIIKRTPVNHPCATYLKHREPMHVSPSQTKATGVVEKVAELGERFNKIDLDVTNLGNCIHQIYCGLDRNHTTEFAQCLINSYGVEANATDIIEMWDKFVDYLTATYGEAASIDHELSFKQSIGGQIVTGSIDYVWITTDGCVLVDYKTFPGRATDALNPSSRHYAGLYKGQLDCYTNVLVKSGRKVIDRLIFYPSLGLVVKVI